MQHWKCLKAKYNFPLRNYYNLISTLGMNISLGTTVIYVSNKLWNGNHAKFNAFQCYLSVTPRKLASVIFIISI
jgi:hypothetical protein